MTLEEEKLLETIRWKTPEHPGVRLAVRGGVPYLYYPALAGLGVIHGFSTRLGGVSEGCLSSMNLSFSRGDAPERVMENFRRIGAAIGFRPADVVLSAQTHTTHVIRVGYEERGLGVMREKTYADVDGMVTDDPGVALCCSFADCVPLYLVDPVRHVIGLAHSGWKGTVGKIGKCAVEKMTACFGTDPADLWTAIGPSICRDCYEVGADVADVFRGAYPRRVADKLLRTRENGKYDLDLQAACRENFLEAGVLPDHILMPQICTACNPRILFSHRASHGMRGNLASFLMLR